jgi:hypothetical protein
MKKTTKKILLAGLLTAIVAGGCKKSWLDINTNPNAPVDASIDPSTLEGGAVLNTATNVVTGYQFLSHWLGFLNTSSGVSPNAEEQSYNISTGFSNAFGTILDNNFDYNIMQQKADATGMTFYSGIAKIMKSLNYARMVDLYNNVPYTATFGAPANLTPKYDDAKTIYEDLIKQIDAGITQIKAADLAANPRLAIVDKMFGASKTKWVQFANTLKLRILMHQAGRADRASYITTEIAKIVAEGSGFIGTGGSATVNPGYSQAQANPYYATYDFNSTGGEASQERANTIMVNVLKNNADPRLAGVYQADASAVPAGSAEPTPTLANPPGITGVYRGGVYGQSIDNATYKYQTRAYLAKVGGAVTASAATGSAVGLVRGWDAPIWIMTSVESLFLQAEAIQRGFLTTSVTADVALQNAIKESFIFLNIGGSAAAATTSFTTWYASQATNANVSYAAAGDKLQVIAYQKYVAMTGVDELEVWNDYRKFGAAYYPFITLSLYPSRSSNILPVRLLYPTNELLYNSDNVPAVGRKSGDQFTAKIWWMP